MFQVMENTLVLNRRAFDLTGINVTLKKNTINASSETAVLLKANENLNIEDNNFAESNALGLKFPSVGVGTIVLRGTDLKSLKTGFICTKVLRTLLIDNCQMKLDNEESFVVDVKNYQQQSLLDEQRVIQG